jgi:hypothetical protein
VFPVILAAIDADRNGTFSEAEQRAYAERVRRDLSLAVDEDPVRLRLVSSAFPTIPEMSQGLGVIELTFDAAVRPGGGNRTLIFRNRHLDGIAVYLVNSLVPDDPAIHLGAQRRDGRQSHYQLDYQQDGRARDAHPVAGSGATAGWLAAAVLPLLAVIAFRWRQRAAPG